MRKRSKLGLLIVWLATAILVLTGAGTASSGASSTARIVFASTLPSWPPPENLDARRVYRVPVSGGKPVMVDRVAPTYDGDGSAILSPDGTRLAVVRGSEEGEASLWSMNTDGRRERKLLAPSSEAFAGVLRSALAWSPDGTRIAAYVVAGCGPGTAPTCLRDAIVIVDIEGRRLATIAGYRDASWAPDGERLAVESNLLLGPTPEEATIDIVRADGTRIRTIAQAKRDPSDGKLVCFQYPTWSASGRLVAFQETNCRDEPRGVFHVVRASDGARVRRIRGGFAGWAPRGERFAYIGAGPRSPLYFVSSQRKVRRLVNSTTGPGGWSRDGTRLYFWGKPASAEEEGRSLSSIRIDGGGLRRIVPHTTGGWPLLPSRDGRRLAFMSAEMQLTVVPEGGGRPRVVARFPARGYVPLLGWSADSRSLLVSNSVPALAESALWTIEPDGLKAQRIPDGKAAASDPSWSPGGSAIVYATRGKIAIIRSDGRAGRTLAAGSAPSWSPNGRAIAYTCEDSAICVVRADGTQKRVVIAPAIDPAVGEMYFFNPDWSPDSQWIVYAKGEPGKGGAIRAVRPNGTGDRLLVATDDERSWFRSPAFSPDGAMLALAGVFCESPNLCQQGIFIADVTGNGPRFLVGTDDGTSPTWSSDGRRIAFSAPASFDPRLPQLRFRQLYTIEADGGVPKPLTSFRADAVDPDWSGGS